MIEAEGNVLREPMILNQVIQSRWSIPDTLKIPHVEPFHVLRGRAGRRARRYFCAVIGWRWPCGCSLVLAGLSMTLNASRPKSIIHNQQRYQQTNERLKERENIPPMDSLKKIDELVRCSHISRCVFLLPPQLISHLPLFSILIHNPWYPQLLHCV